MVAVNNIENYRSYRNVYRQGLMWGLPMMLFFVFAGCSILNLMLLGFIAWVGLWYISLVLLTGNFIAYFFAKGLVATYGTFFIDRLIAHYFLHTFSIVRISRRARHVVTQVQE
jgi:hypothetical protein